ncbi:efflux RND transporter periplasmic adaptor subunit [Aquamicrobium sp. LC103]|uniref:efflux RND transporter periplasmic adaptor subunit n=1 Tax=Aquamicrobium sp. LC103 TaxID=1120658 RepID=UPI00063ED08A|nr:efflux RND transporter periplasmic adaptor subunit [Aquamicrobium sp. LC103]TKT77427.1 efflux RND transporter periplasmic adaptor subunit [Aquamicrobium sp. LC103]
MALPVRKTAFIMLGVLAVGAVLYWTFRPQPVPVDLATIGRADLAVTVVDDGKSRIRDVYAVSAPVAGTVRRTPGRVGDKVEAGRTVVARIQPAAPGFLDARTLREAQAALAAANAAVELADAQLREAEVDATFARSELQRVRTLSGRNVISDRTLEEAQATVARAEARVASAQAAIDMRRREQESAEARLIGPEGGELGEVCCVDVRSPVDGEILAIHHESEAVVAAGTPLVEVGDRADLEIVAELLSSDAVRISPGASATIEGWGGPPLEAEVHRVEPAGFTKVSALGIEEQRVNTVLNLRAPPEERRDLGHGYRVIVRVVVEEHGDVPVVPLGALFRQGRDWAVFTVGTDGQAELRPIEVGARDARNTVIQSGLSEGDRVILHPSDRVTEGTVVTER